MKEVRIPAFVVSLNMNFKKNNNKKVAANDAAIGIIASENHTSCLLRL